MDKNKLPALVGGVLTIVLVVNSPMVVVGGVLWLWLFHRKANFDLSKAVLFRSVAVGGVVAGTISTLLSMFYTGLVSLALFQRLMVPDVDIGLERVLPMVLRSSHLIAWVYSVIAAQVFGFAATLVSDFLPRPQTNTQNTTAS